MIDHIFSVEADGTNPYYNLAEEEYLTQHVKAGECILFLWQNRRSVVIGRNQNCWKECSVEKLEKDGGYLVRRLSGGGAVFHDLGNLNFTFMVRKEDYNLPRQMEVILTAVRSLGIPAEKNGRNDVTVYGRKFSGNAFYMTSKGCYHHGTILLSADQSQMTRYLQVSLDKLALKGVDSVTSRTVNLSEYDSGLTPEKMGEALKSAFSAIYGRSLSPLSANRMNEEAIAVLQKKFQSPSWKYDRKLPFNQEISARFEWGDILIRLYTVHGAVKSARVFSDAMDQNFILQLSSVFEKYRNDTADLEMAVSHIRTDDPRAEQMKNDLMHFLRERL
jgi:lipoate-protein ligase A